MKKPRLTLVILFIVIIALSLVKIFIANSVSTSGIILSRMQEEIGQYKLQNSEISAKLYALSSLTYISSKAKQLGFADDYSQFVLTNQQSVAFKQ